MVAAALRGVVVACFAPVTFWLNPNKDEVKSAPGMTYDRTNTRWVPKKK
jgi:hypothetical protein